MTELVTPFFRSYLLVSILEFSILYFLQILLWLELCATPVDVISL